MAFHRLNAAVAVILTGVLIAFSAAAQQDLAPVPIAPEPAQTPAAPDSTPPPAAQEPAPAAQEPAPAAQEPAAQEPAAVPASAQKIIEQFHATLLNVMKEGRSLGYDGRFQWLQPAVKDTFNLAFMAEITAGTYWNKADDEQRQKYVEAFSKMSTATYAERFDSYAGEKFDITGTEEEGRNSVVIQTQITDHDGGHTLINYLLRNIDGTWKVVDVYLNGSISELAVKKSDYSDVLKSGGIDALVAALNNKVASIATDAGKSEVKTKVR